MPSLEIKLSDGFGILSRMQKGSLVEDVDFVVIARKGVETLGYAEMEKIYSMY